MTRLVSEHDQPHIRSPFDGCTKIPRAAHRAHEDETILETGVLGHGLLRFVHLDLPGLIEVQEDDGVRLVCSSSGRHRSAFDDNAGGHIFAERDQQLSRQGHDRRLT